MKKLFMGYISILTTLIAVMAVIILVQTIQAKTSLVAIEDYLMQYDIILEE